MSSEAVSNPGYGAHLEYSFDSIDKPFHIEELLCKLKTILSWSQSNKSHSIKKASFRVI